MSPIPRLPSQWLGARCRTGAERAESGYSVVAEAVVRSESTQIVKALARAAPPVVAGLRLHAVTSAW
jgi:hypothetical protein